MSRHQPAVIGGGSPAAPPSSRAQKTWTAENKKIKARTALVQTRRPTPEQTKHQTHCRDGLKRTTDLLLQVPIFC